MLERLKAGGEENDRGWGGWMASPTWWIWVWVSSGNWWWTGKPGCAAAHGVTKSQTWLSEWTELHWYITECQGLNCLLYHHAINTLTDCYESFMKNIYIPGGSDGTESTCNAEDPALIPGLGRSSGERNDNPLQYSCLENSMDSGAWQATAHGVAELDTTERLMSYYVMYLDSWECN